MQCNWRKYKLLTKQNRIRLNILVTISVLSMRYKVWKNGFTLRSLLDLRTFEVFQSSHSNPALKHSFDFWLAERYFEPSWKSGPAKTGLAGSVPPPCSYCIDRLVVMTSLARAAWLQVRVACRPLVTHCTLLIKKLVLLLRIIITYCNLIVDTSVRLGIISTALNDDKKRDDYRSN